MAGLTTHILDTANGCPGEGIRITLFRVDADGTLHPLKVAISNSDGRVDTLLLEGAEFQPGTYQLEFAAGDYFRARDTALAEPAFLDVIPIRFGIADEDTHYHVPLLVSPYSYSSYRGS